MQTQSGRPARERIRATAAELFYRQGIRAVGVDELVSRAGATKPSLYRSFESKEQLAAAYLRDFAAAFWRRFDDAVDAHEGEPRAQLRALFSQLARRIRQPRYRGCGLSNAAIEYPQANHPARQVAQQTKQEVRRRLNVMLKAIGVEQPRLLADGLTMLLEGAYVSRQVFGADGPSRSVARVAERMIDQWPGGRSSTGGRARRNSVRG